MVTSEVEMATVESMAAISRVVPGGITRIAARILPGMLVDRTIRGLANVEIRGVACIPPLRLHRPNVTYIRPKADPRKHDN